MYSLDVNFLKDRPDYKGGNTVALKDKQKPSLKLEKPMVIGGAVGVALPVLALAILGVLNWQTSQAENAVAELDAEIANLTAQQQRIQELQAQADQANAEAIALTSIFNQIKPWSAILQDIRDRVPPGVQIETISQSGEEQLTINGIASTYSNVNDFLLSLQESPFLEGDVTRIQSAQRTASNISLEVPEGEAENVTIELPEVVSYTLTTNISDVPASEILQELDNKGAVGLVTRIRTLQQKGIIER
jgi:type IV pilus assembly protein PilN